MSAGGRRIAVIGAGWGGLAAAVDLVVRGHDVHVFEAATEPGGRARRLVLGGRTLDNGQHLLLGAYEATLTLMTRVGIDTAALFERRPLSLYLDAGHDAFALRVPRRGGGAALPMALATMEGIGRRDRWRALRHAPNLRRMPAKDGPVDAWLRDCGQPDRLIDCLWGPLCLAALNAPPPAASARLFATVLAEAFATPRASDLLLPRTDLGTLFPHAACRWLREQGGHVHMATRVRSLDERHGQWHVDTDGEAFDDAVLATDPHAAARLLPDDPNSQEQAHRLHELGSAPIATVYLDYGGHVGLEPPMRGRLDGPGQWVFDRAISGESGVIAVVISGRGRHEALSRDQLAAAVVEQMRSTLPGRAAPNVLGVVREKRATFDPRPGVQALRPGIEGPRPALWFAGDYVDTGLPSTIEGAVRAGRRCATAIDDRGTSQ